MKIFDPIVETIIHSEELLKRLTSQEKEGAEKHHLLILDCRYDLKNPKRGKADYMQLHIPGAIYVSLDQDLSDHTLKKKGRHPLPAPEKLSALFSRLGVRPQTQVVVYDDADGSIAARAWWLFKYMSHDAVAVLNGGWAQWKKEGKPVSQKQESVSPSVFVGKPRQELIVDTDSVLNVPLLVDSRAPERYSGEVEPLDPVAGHIPGAVNRFFKNNVTGENLFLSKDELRERFSSLFRDQDPTKAAFYCGSGVTACHNILASSYAGFPQSKLYPGSWSEWCSDASRSVERSVARPEEPKGSNKKVGKE